MRAGSGKSTAVRVRLTRVVALFLLAYSFADIIYPQYFCEEMLGLYGAGTVSVSHAGDIQGAYAVAESEGSGQDQNSGTIPGDEDCLVRSSVLTSASQSTHVSRAHRVTTILVVAHPVPLLSSAGEAHLTFHPPPGSPPSSVLLNKSIRC